MLKVFKLDPAMFKTKKEKQIKRIGKDKKEKKEQKRKIDKAYNKKKADGFNLLKKWVPGTKKFSRIDLLMETVNYIKELENEIKEVKKESKKRVNYIEELEKKIKELETPQTHPSEPEVVLDPTGVSCTMDVRTTSPTQEEELPEEELLANLEEELLASEEELLANLEEELLANEEELLANLEEELLAIPDFNSMEELRRWLEL
jgi:hypothetical protein